MRYPKYSHSFEVVSELPEPLRPLKKLAYNFRWTWDHATRDLFREIDKPLWEEVGHNPVQLLARVSGSRIEHLANDAVFVTRLNVVEKALDDYLFGDTWFDRHIRERG